MNELMDAIRFEPPPPPPTASSSNSPASGKDADGKAFTSLAKMAYAVVCGILAAIFSGAKSVYRMFRPLKGTDDAGDATGQPLVGLQMQPPPPPAEGEFPET